MKNRNIHFKPTTGLLIALLLACFAAVFISAPTPAKAGDMVPFNGTVSGFVESQEAVDGCTVHVHVVNFGNATELGAFTGYADFYPNFCEDYPNITYTGFFYWTAANGDKFEGAFDGYLTPTDTLGVYDNHETADVTAGGAAPVVLSEPLAISRWADNWSSTRGPLSSPGKGSSQLSAPPSDGL